MKVRKKEAIARFGVAPPLGTVVRLDDQAYRLSSVAPYTRIDGSQSKLLTWTSACPECSEDFDQVTGLVVYSFNRRCRRCHHPLKPVGGKRRWEKARVSIEVPGPVTAPPGAVCRPGEVMVQPDPASVTFMGRQLDTDRAKAEAIAWLSAFSPERPLIVSPSVYRAAMEIPELAALAQNMHVSFPLPVDE